MTFISNYDTAKQCRCRCEFDLRHPGVDSYLKIITALVSATFAFGAVHKVFHAPFRDV